MIDDNLRQRINAIKLHTDPMTQAQLVVEVLRDHPIRNTDLAEHLSFQPSYLSHLIRVTKLPEMVIDGYWNKQLTFTHLILISRLKKPEDIVALYEEILKKNLNVSATERRIREILYLVDSSGKYIQKDRLNTIKSRIESSLGYDANVSIIQTRIKTKITIEIPGNLVKTSEFIDTFANRFRQKKQKGTSNPGIPTQVMSDPMSEVSEITDQYVSGDTNNKLTIEGLQDEKAGELDTTEKKFRFDPDF